MSGTVNQALLRAYQRTLAKAESAAQTSEESMGEGMVDHIAAAVDTMAANTAVAAEAVAHAAVAEATTEACFHMAEPPTAPTVESIVESLVGSTAKVTRPAKSVKPVAVESVYTDEPTDVVFPSVGSFSIDTLPVREPRFAECPIRASRSETFHWDRHLQYIESVASESLTRIADQIQTWTRQRPVSVGIASLRPFQGVTSLAALIAKVLGGRGVRTVLIDADREAPGGVSRCVGLSTALQTMQEEAESLDEAYIQETQTGIQMLSDPRSLAAELSKRLIRNTDSELELLPSHGLAQNPAVMTSVLEAMVEQLCGDRDCVLLDCGVLLEPPFNTAPVTFSGERLTKSEDAVTEPRSKAQTLSERCHLAIQPRLAWMRNMLDCVLLVRDAGTVSNAVTLQAVQELHRCGLITVAVIDNFCGQA